MEARSHYMEKNGEKKALGQRVGRKYQTKGKDKENDKRLSLALRKEQTTEQRQSYKIIPGIIGKE